MPLQFPFLGLLRPLSKGLVLGAFQLLLIILIGHKKGKHPRVLSQHLRLRIPPLRLLSQHLRIARKVDKLGDASVARKVAQFGAEKVVAKLESSVGAGAAPVEAGAVASLVAKVFPAFYLGLLVE